ncbi:hypothetical protein DsansV1_C23g0177751 [Dioscorea sansibarensis]
MFDDLIAIPIMSLMLCCFDPCFDAFACFIHIVRCLVYWMCKLLLLLSFLLFMDGEYCILWINIECDFVFSYAIIHVIFNLTLCLGNTFCCNYKIFFKA